MTKPWFLKINKWVLLLITFILFILGGVLIWLSVAVIKENNTWLLVLMVVDFFLFTVSMNSFISRTIVYKPKKINYPKKEYTYKDADTLKETLLKNGFKERVKDFGSSFILIENKTAYKVLLILNEEKYFNQDENKKEEATKGIDKCERFVGFEIFYNASSKVLDEIPNFSFVSDKVLYEGFYIDLNQQSIVEANAIDPLKLSSYKENLLNKLEINIKQ